MRLCEKTQLSNIRDYLTYIEFLLINVVDDIFLYYFE